MAAIAWGINDGAILRLLRDHGPLSRAALARRSMLSATTMTKLTARLIDAGILREVQDMVEPAGIGRPPIDVALVETAYHVIGIHIGAGLVQVGMSDLVAQCTPARSFEFNPDSDSSQAVLDRVAAEIESLIADQKVDRRRILGMGVGVPGPVDQDGRHLLLSINAGWRNAAVADHLEERTGLSTTVEHNVRAMALGEQVYGGGNDAGSLLYVYLRTGLGAGLVVDGRPFRPGSYGVTELGHIQVVENGLPCACGSRGCLETVLSESYLADQVAKAGGNPSSPLRALAHMPEARAAMIDHLTTALSSAVNLLNPDLIVLGGIFAEAPPALAEAVEHDLREKAFPILRDTVRVRLSALGADAGMPSAAAVALDHFVYRAKV
ncbi:ROK family transcriptional regulator [Stakelama saccharophila]|uniref:ROK family transcriptional regulator n=1 Tax=Stakelama saccharophila TaxID=3075605 RepID=A0ABZ0B565_9SPHN|nr:ROK family transcriptional regulator [Stakelama sp. W311]WNO52428.1 ROK family transcriptional regulator [Stakelama sp. W311]